AFRGSNRGKTGKAETSATKLYRQFLRPSCLAIAWYTLLKTLLLLLLRAWRWRYEITSPVGGDQQAVMLPHMLGISNPVVQMLQDAGVAFLLNFSGTVID